MEDRKARLAALAAKAGRSNQNDSPNTGTDGTDGTIADDRDAAGTTLTADDHHPDSHTAGKKRKIHFRNYIPSDPTLLQSNNDDGDREVTTIKPTSTAMPQHPPPPPPPNVTTTTLQQQQQRTAAQVLATPTATATKSVLQLALEQARLEIRSTGSHPPPLDHPPVASAHMVSPPHDKINADLKRNCQSKLRLLEKRTQNALVSILRERLEQEATTTATTTTK